MLVLLVAATSIPILAATAAGENSASETDDAQWVVPTNSETIDTYANIMLPETVVNFWGTHMSVSELSDNGGLKYDFKTNQQGIVYQGMEQEFDLSHLAFKFNNLTDSSPASSAFVIYLTNDEAKAGGSSGNIDFVVDPGNSQFYIRTGDYKNGDTFGPIRSDILKYENIAGKEFRIYFKESATADCWDVSVTVGGETVTAEKFITPEVLAAAGITDTERLYCGIGTWTGSANMSVELNGIAIKKYETFGTAVTKNDLYFGEAAQYNNINRWNGWGSNNWFSQRVAPAGGMRLVWQNAFRNVAQGSAAKTEFNNLLISLSGIRKYRNIYANVGSKAPDPKIAVIFTNNGLSTATSTYDGMFSLVIDTVDGKLTVSRDKNFTYSDDTLYDTIITDDAIKFSNIAGKRVDIHLTAADNGDYTVWLTIGDKVISGIISAQTLAKSTAFDPAAETYTHFTPAVAEGVGNGWFYFDLIECVNAYTHTDVIKAIEAIGEITLEGSSESLRAARAEYDKLSGSEKAKVSNYTELVEKENAYKALVAEADSELLPVKLSQLSFANRIHPHIYNTYYTNWKPYIQTSSGLNGVKFNFVNAPAKAGVGDSYLSLANISGLKLQFDAFDFSDSSAAQPAIVLGKMPDEYAPHFNQSLAFVLEPDNGNIRMYSPANSEGTAIIENCELLKEDNIKHRRFSYAFNAESDGSYTFTVSVSGQTVTGTVPASVFAESGLMLSKTQMVVKLTNCAKSSFSLEWTGIGYDRIGGKYPNVELTDENLRTVGLTALECGTVNMQLAGSGFEFNIAGTESGGSEVYAQFSSQLDLTKYLNYNYFDVFINGVYTKKLEVRPGVTQHLLYNSYVEPGTVVNIKVVKVTDFENSCSIMLDGINLTDSVKFAGIKESGKKKMLVIGDSISAGQEILSADNTVSERKDYDAAQAYAYQTAGLLDVDIDLFAYSGSGLLYEKCSAIMSDFRHCKNIRFRESYDYIVINLGTNDSSMGADETTAAYKSFVEEIAVEYPQAQVVFAYGMMRKNNLDAIKAAVEAVEAKNVSFCELPLAGEGETGKYAHPLLPVHNAAAKVLYKHIKLLSDILGDIDGNGVVEANDLKAMRQYLLGNGSIDEIMADLNNSGSVDIVDLVRLKKMIAGI